MKSNSIMFSIFLSLSLFISLNALLEEGNIYLEMTSNFTLQHYQNKINNKKYYTIILQIGTPGEEYELQIDTSTSPSSSSSFINLLVGDEVLESSGSYKRWAKRQFLHL